MTDTTGILVNGFTLTREFDAPRDLVWQMWTKPEHFSQWFGEHGSSVPIETASMDVRVGGTYRLIMHVEEPEHLELPFSGTYREVDEPARLVLTLDNFEDPASPDVEVMEVDLHDIGDGRTRMVFTQTGHLGADEYVLTRRGSSIFFDRMAEHIAAVVAAR